MQLRTRIAAAITLLAVAAVTAVVASGSASAASDVVGHLYVNDNTAGTNTIAAAPTHEHAHMLKSRIEFIREKLIPMAEQLGQPS